MTKHEKVCWDCKLSKPLTEYYNNKSAKDGLNTQCKECNLAYRRKYYATNTQKCLDVNKEYRALNKKSIKSQKLQYSYGISLEDYNRMKIEQNNKCSICSKDAANLNHKLNVDHCHVTGKIRGLLCRNCNTALGKFKDDCNILQNAINYIKRTQDGQ